MKPAPKLAMVIAPKAEKLAEKPSRVATALSEKEKFWMVFVHKGRNPAKRHASVASAMIEAARLSVIQKQPAFVLEALGFIPAPPKEDLTPAKA